MRKPNESLDDFTVKPSSELTIEPPSEVRLQSTGEVETLRPLAHRETTPARTRAYRPNPLRQPLWFRGLLAVGSGALVMIAFALVSAILIGINEPATGDEVAANEQPADTVTQTEEPFSIDSLSPSSFAAVTEAIDIVRAKVRRRNVRPGILQARYKPRQLRRLPQPEEPKFVPTTLVIYAKNGVINTRVEPWLQPGDKRLPTFNN